MNIKLGKLQEVKKTISCIPKNYFGISLISYLLGNFNRYSLNNIGNSYFSQFVDRYVCDLSKFLEKQYKINLDKLNASDIQELTKMEHLQNDMLINLLLSYDRLFYEIRRSINIDSLEKVFRLNKILKVYDTAQSTDFSVDDYTNYLVDVPNQIYSSFLKNNLLYRYANLQIKYFETKDNEILQIKRRRETSIYEEKQQKNIYLNS